ncbi:HalOD1 output domain-containing protein [Natrarchaeobius sp. A-rgal3]|uniref:HalOD1 output domain-containing protein n=1 Tax=Natrarchaeobius versutus TaxID=1679078 RepID=UPI003510B9C0
MNQGCPSTTVSPSDESRPSMAIVDLVARTEGVDPIELEPLYDTVDPDGLDSLCESSAESLGIEFTYAGRTVLVERTCDGVEITLVDSVHQTDASGAVDTESST